MYRAGKLASRPDSLALCIASPQTLSSEIVLLLQEQPSPKFAMGGVDFEFMPEWFMPGKPVLYILRYGGNDIILGRAFINIVTPCGPRSNMDLTYYIRTIF